jgi:hypothetical protein
MLPDITKFPINWSDGMKISSKDFIDFENAIFDSIRDARAIPLHDFAYGLLPSNHPEIDPYPKLVYDNSEQVLLLKECRALTPGGQRIEITEVNFERKKFPSKYPSLPVPVQNSGTFDVYLHIHPLKRLGAGEFSSDNPPRYQLVSPLYELSIRPKEEVVIEQDNFLKISEIEIREGRVEVLTNSGKYIPPCTSLCASSALKKLHEIGAERLKSCLLHFSTLTSRVSRETRNEMVQEVVVLVEKLVTPIVSSLYHYQAILSFYPPIHIISYMKDYARFVQFQLDRPFRTGIVNELKPKLMEHLLSFGRLEPKHGAIKLSFDKMLQLLVEIESFLGELSMYNYENKSFDLQDFNKPVSVPKVMLPVVEETSSTLNTSHEIKRSERRF